MARISSAAPLLGAALAAALMVAATAGFQAGAGAQIDDAAAPAGRPSSALMHNRLRARGDSAGSEASPADEHDFVPDAAPPRMRAKLAIIIDDVADLQTAARIWAIDIPITLAVLPYADAAPDIAMQAGGREIFVHLPMEPVGLEDPGPYALTKSLSARDFRARLVWAFQRVPGAVGFNNHMGSRLTADPAAMALLFSSLEERSGDLVFVDSLTHPRSVAGEVAQAAGFQVLRRSVFLDHWRDPAIIDAQLEAALDEALAHGRAVAIGHPYAMTIDALASLEARAEAAGVELTSVSALVAD